MKTPDPKKLLDDYYNAMVAIEDYREEVLPIGTRVRVGKTAAVVALHHPLYPDCVIVKDAGGFMTALVDECVVVKGGRKP